MSFIHLADIHFNKNSGDPYDLDADIRNELLRDIKEQAKNEIDNFEGILLCGDIAFSAQESEYHSAEFFLEAIRETLSIQEGNIFCVPGNHDVDQSITKETMVVQHLHKSLESASSQLEFDKTYAKCSRSEVDAKMMYLPISNYNSKFASLYNCSISCDHPTRYDIVKINKEYKLAIHTINSTLISSHLDHVDKEKERLMRIPEAQIPSYLGKNIINMSLCHHPPQCWLDHDNSLQTKLDERVQVQLYGHMHMQTVLKKAKSVIINSGATHPDRSADWYPRYNWISIDIKDTILEVIIFPRIWDGNSKFIAELSDEGANHIKYCLNLSIKKNNKVDDKMEHIIEFETNDVITGVSKKAFVYAFLSLPIVKRNLIISELGLIRDDDDGKEHNEICGELIERAIEDSKLDEFWTRVKKGR